MKGNQCLEVVWWHITGNSQKPSSKIFFWPFQGGTSFVDLLCLCSVLCLLCLCARLFIVLCSHLLGKGWPLGSRLWCLTVSLSLSHRYPGSGVVLDCIGSWSLHPYLLWGKNLKICKPQSMFSVVIMLSYIVDCSYSKVCLYMDNQNWFPYDVGAKTISKSDI